MDGTIVSHDDIQDDGAGTASKPRTDLIHRNTLEELLGWRGKALALAEEARDQYLVTLEKIKDACGIAHKAGGGKSPFYKLNDYVKEDHDKPERFSKKVRHDLDRAMWQHLLTITGIEGLMDRQALREFEQQLASDPPEITADTVRATFQQFKSDAHTIFRRGLVNAFNELDRTYRSHDGFKIGNRLVRSYALSESGWLWDSIPSLRDVDRIMHILDGHKVVEGWTSPLVGRLDRAQTHSYSSGIIPGTVTTEYWHVKWFKNRNMHLYPQRKDLVRRANRLIAEHFGEAVGAGPDAAGANRYHRAKPYHSAVEDFYPTPPAVVTKMLNAAQLQRGQDVLEPSAGEGAIALSIMAAGIIPDCVEVDPDRADTLRDLLPPGTVINMDFLAMHADPEYDRILMNPPFGKLAGVAHVFHATKFLKPGGKLVAILGAGLEYREDGPSTELRNLIAAWNGTIEKLPAGSFKSAGTMVDSVMLTMTKPGGVVAALPAPSAANLFDILED